MVDLLPLKLSQALLDYLRRHYAPAEAAADTSLSLASGAGIWVSMSNQSIGALISAQAIADICQAHMWRSKARQLRNTFAHTMKQQGARLSEIQRRLGHKSISPSHSIC